MVIEQKAVVGELKKFPLGIQRLFGLASNFNSCCETTSIFRAFCKETGHNPGQIPETYGNIQQPLSQTYPQWKVMCDVQKLHSFQKRKQFKNRVIYILPLGTLDEKETVDSLINEYNKDGLPSHCLSLLHVVIKFIRLFFCGMEIKLLPFQDIDNLCFTTRVHDRTNKKQILVTDILGYLKKIRPIDSFCIIGWSSLDLYPCPELNFVLGEASFDAGSAVISFGHYADVAEDDVKKKSEIVVDSDVLSFDHVQAEYPLWHCNNLNDKVVWRTLKVLTHEICHLLGMHHCTFFDCLMNESKSVSQAQSQSLFLCPVCLRKLHKFLQFPIVERYKMLKDFFMELLCILMKTKRLSLLSCNNQSNTTEDIQDNGHFEHTDNVFAIINSEDRTYNSYTVQKFKSSLNWLDSVLKFIG